MPEHLPSLPSVENLRAAVGIYLEVAYPRGASAAVTGRLPAWLIESGADVARGDLAAWLDSDAVERDPPGASATAARAISVRLGNSVYPHMKLRMSRPPRHEELLFSVDSHDDFLTAGAEADAGPLEELKRHNAELARAVHAGWAKAGVPTEGVWLRSKVAEAQQRRAGGRR
jgi:hypothetical protein